MTTQNMELLDLETGEYLELGEKWVYGEKYIYVMPTHYLQIADTDHIIKLYYNDKVEIIDCEIPDEYKERVLPKGQLLPKGQFSKYIINGKEYDMGYFIGLGSTPINDAINDAKKCEKSVPPLKLKEFCKKTGAVIYGGRYLLAQNTMCEYSIFYKITYADFISAQIPRNFEYDQHIFSDVIKREPQYFSDKFICKEKDYLEIIKRLHKIQDNQRIEILQVNHCRKVDILNEYSKQLRNEPNKFDELIQHCK